MGFETFGGNQNEINKAQTSVVEVTPGDALQQFDHDGLVAALGVLAENLPGSDELEEDERDRLVLKKLTEVLTRFAVPNVLQGAGGTLLELAIPLQKASGELYVVGVKPLAAALGNAVIDSRTDSEGRTPSKILSYELGVLASPVHSLLDSIAAR